MIGGWSGSSQYTSDSNTERYRCHESDSNKETDGLTTSRPLSNIVCCRHGKCSLLYLNRIEINVFLSYLILSDLILLMALRDMTHVALKSSQRGD